MCDYVTDGNGKTSSTQELTSLVQSNAEAQAFFRKIAGVIYTTQSSLSSMLARVNTLKLIYSSLYMLPQMSDSTTSSK